MVLVVELLPDAVVAEIEREENKEVKSDVTAGELRL